MFHILGFIFFFLLVIFIIGLVLLSKVLRTIFGFGRKMTGNTTKGNAGRSTAYSEEASQGNTRYSQQKGKARKKIFDKDEGEYIDFEEIKGE
ncbi:DUF4834 family protein [uncultured Phocaeicola sp.]|uniref:DUF4834 family protein n=1 Tax=uncultured Phocaeicola sp. TaxID=990718 RepID=UPI0025EE3792|nr:DUF4834 family protein [uncultured Phocaeicola sp.]